MDDMIFEEFKGTGNMELYLDKSLSERRIFPAINIQKSSTRHDDLLLNKKVLDTQELIRREWLSSNPIEETQTILKALSTTQSNNVLCTALMDSKKKA